MSEYMLCRTCAHKESCTYRIGRARVFQCEEFEGLKHPAQHLKKRGLSVPDSKKQRDTGGLCSNSEPPRT